MSKCESHGIDCMVSAQGRQKGISQGIDPHTNGNLINDEEHYNQAGKVGPFNKLC